MIATVGTKRTLGGRWTAAPPGRLATAVTRYSHRGEEGYVYPTSIHCSMAAAGEASQVRFSCFAPLVTPKKHRDETLKTWPRGASRDSPRGGAPERCPW